MTSSGIETATFRLLSALPQGFGSVLGSDLARLPDILTEVSCGFLRVPPNSLDSTSDAAFHFVCTSCIRQFASHFVCQCMNILLRYT